MQLACIIIEKVVQNKDILAKENCSPQNAYVFGDSERSDISPALKLGINAFLIKDSRKIQNIIENIIK